MSEWCSVCRTRVDNSDMVEGRRGEKLACPDCGTALKNAKKTRRSPRNRRE
jgi:hypothetical protein